MTTPHTQPLRDEHLALLPELAALRTAADAIGSPNAVEQIERAHRLIDRHLLPHMTAEERALYPMINALSQDVDVTATLRRDHDEIRRLAARLAAPAAESDDNDLRATLYGLDAIVRLHMATEEELYYPLIDESLDEATAATVIGSVHAVEHDLHRPS